jgi:hypothetical protein
MPKINNVHRLDRLKERLAQIEREEEVDIRDINNLLSDEQEQRLKDLWKDEQAKRKNKSYKKDEWKTKRDFRITVLKDVINQIDDNLLNELEELQQQREVKAARVFMDAYCEAKENNQNAMSKANIALQRAGFRPIDRRVNSMSRRDREVRQVEEELKKRILDGMTKEEREQLELLKETEEAEKKSKKR